MRDEGKVPYSIKSIWLDAFQPGHIQVLDSLDAEGNTATQQDGLSSRACSADGCLDGEDSYRLDIPGESCLGCPEDV